MGADRDDTSLAHEPHWCEGRTYVASKAALLAHWRAMTTQLKPAQPQPATQALQHGSTRRGYLGSRRA